MHSIHAVQSLVALKSDIVNGLRSEDAAKRLAKNGPNRLKGEKKISLLHRLFAQFKDFLVIILLAAAVISVVFGDGLIDAIIIVAILIINMTISVVQENRADNALKELKNMSNPRAKVKRDGEIIQINSEDVVVGDIIILDVGDCIPADARLIECVNLRTDESSLTGESMPAKKDSNDVFKEDVGIADRKNIVYSGTAVNYGRGVAVVFATGMNTEMGKIAKVLNETIEASTPLQDKLNSMAKTLGIFCIATCVLVFAIAILYNWLGFGEAREITQMLMVSASLAVAAVPEGIAIVATVILAIGVRKMVKANVIVKKLRAVETLGSTTVICSDKTGTLTQNKMTIVKISDCENTYEVTGVGYKAKGIVVSDKVISRNVELMAEVGVLCNDAIYDKKQESIIGDPTEGAMLVFGAKLGHDKATLNEVHRRIHEIPFDSNRKMMSTYNVHGDAVIMNTKGAPDAVINRCNSVYLDGEVIPMSETLREQLLEKNKQHASEALRVLALAYKRYPNAASIDNVEDNLTFIGMVCMIDPPREEVKTAVEQCHVAGINVKMITGDHKITALAIAKKLGISRKNDEALDGSDLNNMSDEDLKKRVVSVNVFARVSPEHKVRIVTAIKNAGHIVAMTGDGVNDAPSLKKADIGIAMGITGTDVSKEAADMILTDDNFVSIVSAVERGRTIYSNIRKVAGYLLGCNIGEILIILVAILLGLPVPLVATQLLLLNLLTDAFPAFALAMERKERGIMRKKPRDPEEAIIDRSMMKSIITRACFLCFSALCAFLYGLYGVVAPSGVSQHVLAMSLCFFTLTASELLVAYPAKSENPFSGFRDMFRNKFLNASMIASFAILFAVMYVPFLNSLFTIIPPSPLQLIVCLILVAVPVIGFELTKLSGDNDRYI